MKLTDRDKIHLRGYAEALQDMMKKITGENTWDKRYDPISFDDEYIHSYAFDFKKGGRHHSLSDFESAIEIENLMLKEAVEWCDYWSE